MDENFKRTFWKILLIIEEVILIFIVFSFIYQIITFETKDKFYLKLSLSYIKQNPLSFLPLIIFSLLSFICRALALKHNFLFHNYHFSLKKVLKTLAQIDLRRAISPLGLVSSINFLDPERKTLTGAKIFATQQLIITLADWLLFSLLIILTNLFFLPLLIVFFIILFLVLIKPQSLKLKFKMFCLLLLADIFRFLIFYLGFIIFQVSTSFKKISYIFIGWEFSSAITPMFYGTGVSELVASIIAYFSKISFQNVLLPLFLIRAIIIYIPLIFFLFIRDKK